MKVNFIPPTSDDYTLELIPAFTFDGKTWDAHITESFYYFRQPSIKSKNVSFYPFTKKKTFFSINSQIDVAPLGYHLFGEIWIDKTGINKMRTTIPMEISSGL